MSDNMPPLGPYRLLTDPRPHDTARQGWDVTWVTIIILGIALYVWLWRVVPA